MNTPAPRVTFEHLRLVEASALYEYRANTELWKRVGNGAFARRIAKEPRSLSHAGGSLPAGASAFILYHAWKPGYVELTRRQAVVVRKILRGEPTRRAPRGRAERELAALNWCKPEGVNVPNLIKRTHDRFVAIQNERELRRLLRLIVPREPRVVLEIGSARGGTLYCFSQLAHPDALLVSVDLPGAPNCGGQTATERRVFRSFARPRQRMVFIPSDSHLDATRRAVRRALSGRSVDLLFIDGDHSRAGVEADFNLYSGFVGRGGMIAFHDIVAHEETWDRDFAVGDFWDEVKHKHRSTEIIDPTGATRPPLREGQHPAWGIGILWM